MYSFRVNNFQFNAQPFVRSSRSYFAFVVSDELKINTGSVVCRNTPVLPVFMYQKGMVLIRTDVHSCQYRRYTTPGHRPARRFCYV